jgi:hypothetical protein
MTGAQVGGGLVQGHSQRGRIQGRVSSGGRGKGLVQGLSQANKRGGRFLCSYSNILYSVQCNIHRVWFTFLLTEYCRYCTVPGTFNSWWYR